MLDMISHDCYWKRMLLAKLAIRDNFFPNMWSAIRRETNRTRFFGRGDIQQKGKVHSFGLAGKPPLVVSLSGTS